MRRKRGALLLDVLIGIGMLALLTALAGRLLWSSFQVLGDQARSAQALAQAQEALALLQRDVPAAVRANCSPAGLVLVTSGARKITYQNTAAGLTRKDVHSPPREWPLLRAQFALSPSALVEVRLATSGLERRPGMKCETAIWARALETP